MSFKPAFLTCLTVMLFATATVSAYIFDKRDKELKNENKSIRNEIPYTDTAVYQWCEGYLNGDFDLCDNRTWKEDVRISSFYSSDQLYSSELSIPLYKTLLNKSSESITAIRELPVEGDSQDYSENIRFDLSISYKPFIENDLNFDFDYYKAMCDDYLSGKLEKQEFEAEVENWIVQVFADSLQFSDNESTIECTLYELEENGRYVVSNSSDFYLTLLKEQGALTVLKDFEEEFKKQFDMVTEEYLN